MFDLSFSHPSNGSGSGSRTLKAPCMISCVLVPWRKFVCVCIVRRELLKSDSTSKHLTASKRYGGTPVEIYLEGVDNETETLHNIKSNRFIWKSETKYKTENHNETKRIETPPDYGNKAKQNKMPDMNESIHQTNKSIQIETKQNKLWNEPNEPVKSAFFAEASLTNCKVQ